MWSKVLLVFASVGVAVVSTKYTINIDSAQRVKVECTKVVRYAEDYVGHWSEDR